MSKLSASMSTAWMSSRIWGSSKMAVKHSDDEPPEELTGLEAVMEDAEDEVGEGCWRNTSKEGIK